MAKTWDSVAGVFVDDAPGATSTAKRTNDFFVPSLGTSPLDPPDDPPRGPAPVVSSLPPPEIGS